MYDALLVVSFGGPEKPDDVLPFLENVLRGKNVPRERLLEVAEHYHHFNGRSPINDHARALISALRALLAAEGPDLPIYWGNRNWHPLLPDAIRQMRDDGVRRALAFVTSTFSSYSGCRQYRENIDHARAEAGPGAPEIDKLRPFYNHPGFLEPVAAHLRARLAQAGSGAEVVFTAHSIPISMARTCAYEAQLAEACSLVAAMAGHRRFRLVYQSRSGPPSQPWLEPDICAWLESRAQAGDRSPVVLVPIGFLSDHIEVLWDLDVEAAHTARDHGIPLIRVPTVGVHPRFIAMIRELILERLDPAREKRFLGSFPPCPDVCPDSCCPPPPRLRP